MVNAVLRLLVTVTARLDLNPDTCSESNARRDTLTDTIPVPLRATTRGYFVRVGNRETCIARPPTRNA